MFGLGVMELVLVLLILGVLLAFVAAVVVVLVLVLRKKPASLEGTAALPGPRTQRSFGVEPPGEHDAPQR